MKKKIGEIFTITREVSAGTGYSYYLALLTEGLALIDSGTSEQGNHLAGGNVLQTFTFICLKEGEASFQLAKFRVFDPADILYENVSTVKIENVSYAGDNSRGGWTEYHELSPEERKIFEEAFEGLIGVKYTPVMVKSQIVNGVNYIYIADAVGAYLDAISFKTQVSIYKPTQGKAVITNIVKIDEDMLKVIK